MKEEIRFGFIKFTKKEWKIFVVIVFFIGVCTWAYFTIFVYPNLFQTNYHIYKNECHNESNMQELDNCLSKCVNDNINKIGNDTQEYCDWYCSGLKTKQVCNEVEVEAIRIEGKEECYEFYNSKACDNFISSTIPKKSITKNWLDKNCLCQSTKECIEYNIGCNPKCLTYQCGEYTIKIK